MSNLYELTGKYLQIQAVLEADDEDYPIDMLTIGEDLNQKIENYGFIIRNFEAEEEALTSEIKRLTERRNTARKAIDRLKEAVFKSMKMTDRQKVKTDHFSFSIAKKGGKLPVTITGDVPEAYCKVVLEPDKEKIRTAIEEDGEVLDFAHLEERGEYLRMK